MTDLSTHPAYASTSPRATSPRAADRKPWPLLPYICVFAAGAAGLLAGRAMGGNAGAFDSKLLLLLRFMAAMKFAGVIAAAAAVHWRLSFPIQRGWVLPYLAALVIMATAPGLIWSLGGIAIGALLFHIGLLAFLVLAWKDEGAPLPGRRA